MTKNRTKSIPEVEFKYGGRLFQTPEVVIYQRWIFDLPYMLKARNKTKATLREIVNALIAANVDRWPLQRLGVASGVQS